MTARDFADHNWSKTLTQRDQSAVNRWQKTIESLAASIEAAEQKFCKEMKRVEEENSRLKRESWDDGDRIQQLQKELSDLRCLAGNMKGYSNVVEKQRGRIKELEERVNTLDSNNDQLISIIETRVTRIKELQAELAKCQQATTEPPRGTK